MNLIRSFRNIPKYSFAISPTQKIFLSRIDRIVQTLRQQLKPTFLRVRDISMKTIDDDQMIRVEVESQLFRDIPKIDQHRMVIACFGEDIQELHAFLIKTRIPLKENVVIINPQQQILQQQLNQQGAIPLETIQQAVHQIQEQDKEILNKEVEAELKQQQEQKFQQKEQKLHSKQSQFTGNSNQKPK